MANNPPPYADIAGISRAAMKDNAQETIQNYNGVARPGELVVDQLTDSLYVGDPQGNLTLVGPALLASTVNGTTVVLSQSNQNQQIIITNGGQVNVPLNATVPLPVGYAVTVVVGDTNAGYVGVTNSTSRVYISGQDVNALGAVGSADQAILLKHSMYGLLQVATDVWILSGPGITESYC